MAQIEINGITYHTLRLQAFDQWHVARKLLPFMPALAPMLRLLSEAEAGRSVSDEEQDQAASRITDTLARMSYSDSNFIMNICLDAVRRADPQGNLHNVRVSGDPEAKGQLLFGADMNMDVVLRLVMKVCEEDVFPFLPALLPGFLGPAQPNGAAAPEMAAPTVQQVPMMGSVGSQTG